MQRKIFHIQLTGLVQGIGFRPYVYQLAQQWKLKGWVNNGVDGVHIRIQATPQRAHDFYDHLLAHPPPLAHILSHSLQAIAEEATFQGFQIVESAVVGRPQVLLAPDLAMCNACRQDILENQNRRHNYAFTTCTQCGPRYTIIEELPYDRERTAMEVFTPCQRCREEYEDPEDRRYYSQTNSCPDCGILLALYGPDRKALEGTQQGLLQRAVEYLKAGQIVAVKGVGGFLLLCDATREDVIKRLRKRKIRSRKPFAVLYPDLEQLTEDVVLTPSHREWLSGSVSPIVLANLRSARPSGLCASQVAPGLDQVGVMIPYAPLLELLARAFGRPLVATSANPSGRPLIYQNEVARSDVWELADALLTHNRQVIVPVDDSVLRLSTQTQQPIWLRRARGLAPLIDFIPSGRALLPATVAMGGDLKGAFSWTHQKQLYVSQYYGDLQQYETQERYRAGLHHFFRIFNQEPQRVIVDAHPDYFSRREGERLAEKLGVEVIPVQHHMAHFAAVLGEHQLLESIDPVLGVIWDGTGWGLDGHIWGGEFFIFRQQQIERADHFAYFPVIAGDKMAREPRLSALSLLHDQDNVAQLLSDRFSEQEWRIYRQLLAREERRKTSSVGRLFDGAASMLGILDRGEYEGEAPLYLEALARKYLQATDWKKRSGYPFLDNSGQPSGKRLLTEIGKALSRQEDPGKIAARFHQSLVEVIQHVARKNRISNLAFSGGVFQNELLVDLLKVQLGTTHTLYFQQRLSPNDESISFGQLLYFHLNHVWNSE